MDRTSVPILAQELERVRVTSTPAAFIAMVVVIPVLIGACGVVKKALAAVFMPA